MRAAGRRKGETHIEPAGATARQSGLVVAAHGRHAVVEDDAGTRHLCHPRGKRLEVVVGDAVDWQVTGDGGVIEKVQDRRNLMFRQDAWRTKSFAANLDQVLMLVAAEPVFSESQLARALIAAEHAGLRALIGLNKIDLPQAVQARERLAPYARMGYELLELSLKHAREPALQTLQARLQGKRTLVIGASGMGKSTLINLLVPQADAAVGEISLALRAGRHTTTDSRWYWLNGQRDAAVIDTPGFQEFGLRQIEATELDRHMPDLRPHLGQCRFSNCSHRQEPGCAVRQALAQGQISEHRMRIYEEIRGELEVIHR